jgi:hypothetical protein
MSKRGPALNGFDGVYSNGSATGKGKGKAVQVDGHENENGNGLSLHARHGSEGVGGAFHSDLGEDGEEEEGLYDD